ncbi:unnamed protein product [Adineta ricciae]|uniref:Uncharacterized protein n=1 Tax=Adineta ricciae TaxID=249248 RepID=A0A815BFZ1_ADIRI|nr:unnamed protein product [Adineta ricciae]CAF1268972.1 unnamed protein product [Adineta ricciae]
MSQSNGLTTATMTNNKLNVNGNEAEWDNKCDVFNRLQSLIPAIKQNFILISQQYNQFLNDTDELNKTFTAMQLKQEKLERELDFYRKDLNDFNKQIDSNADNRVYLDVGGHHFTTTIKTLTQSNSLFFKAFLTKEWNRNANTADNRIFIDRDGRIFDLVLKYLRTGELNIEDRTIRKELLTEAKFYKIQSLEDELNSLLRKDESSLTVNLTNQSSPPCSPAPAVNRTRSSPYTPSASPNALTRSSPFNQSMPTKSKPHPAQTALSWRTTIPSENRLNIFLGSTLITSEYEEKLSEFIGPEMMTQQPWKLIYRASEHGFDAADFHRCSESYAPTVSIIQTDFGNIFGGFTSVSWSSATLRADQADPTAFLFTLKNTLNIPPTKFPVAKEYQQCAISHNPTCGPNFGSPKNEGSDLCLRNKFNEKTNCIFFPKSYVDTTNLGSSIFAKKYFACKEVEVFTITTQ